MCEKSVCTVDVRRFFQKASRVFSLGNYGSASSHLIICNVGDSHTLNAQLPLRVDTGCLKRGKKPVSAVHVMSALLRCNLNASGESSYLEWASYRLYKSHLQHLHVVSKEPELAP